VNPDDAAQDVISDINNHPLMDTDVPKSTSAEFLEIIIDDLQSSLNALREEIEREG
jgi:hypothetical protein